MNALVLVALGAIGVVALILVAGALQRLDRPPRPARSDRPGTEADPDVAAMVARQKFHGRLLREDGKSLLRPLVDGRPRGFGKSYRPVLTSPQAEKPAMAAKVTPIRRAK